MVTNIYMKCDVCNSIVDLKWQVGHIKQAPVSIVCPECKTILKFDLITDQENITIDMTTKNATRVEGDDYDFIAETSSELLTYKITKQRNVKPGMTPFIRSIQYIGPENYESFRKCFLRGIEVYENELHIYQRINDLYYNNNIQYLSQQLKDRLDLDSSYIHTDKTLLEHLYTYNINIYSAFLKDKTITNYNKENLRLMKILRIEKKIAYNKFLTEHCTVERLKDCDLRLFRSLNSIINNYYLFLPSTLLCYINESSHDAIYKEYTLTTTDFTDIKNIYLTVYENLLSVYDTIILLNNILERDNYCQFPTEILIKNKSINTFNQFSRLSKGDKQKFLDLNVGFDSLMPKFDNKVRNAIGHESWNYIPYEHKIEIFNTSGILTDELFLLEFVYDCWMLFEKVVMVYKTIQDIKNHRLDTIN
ncbi:hypothetical protein [Fusibacter sp. 3D3]|uniref:hypothetical protein n=1 Tax=Fusibacter sp. 3D3 TaxID=1048380 RepID=UPI0008533CAC|nr:hypothetical protein [Fusibacter sp. 3D3]GAU76940.1 hypothetical protein F3D3_1539 [Fusibacter sp. 3D3]